MALSTGATQPKLAGGYAQLRIDVRKRLRRSPSLRPELPATLADAYADARKLAVDATGLALATFPDACPWSLNELQNEDFLPAEVTRG